MVENIFILGAGASVDCGAPLMNNFLDRAEDIWRNNNFKEDQERIGKVFKLLAELQKAHSKSFLDLNNIETLFGALEMAKMTKTLSDYTEQEISEFRECLVLLIVRTLEESIEFDKDLEFGIRPHESYDRLVKLLDDKALSTSSVFTFNYDVALDLAFHGNNIGINYCLDNRRDGKINLLKLHGSINWVRRAKEILPFMLEWFTQDSSLVRTHLNSTKLIFSKRLDRIKTYHGNGPFDELPVIVPPTWNKTEYHGTLTNVWTEAAKNLSTARNIYVFGYSLPETDSFFKYLYSLGTISDSRIRRFWVFDPDDQGRVQKRFQELLGRGVANRYKYFQTTFSDGIEILREELGLSSKGDMIITSF